MLEKEVFSKKAVAFTNPTDEVFVGVWDKEEYKIKPNQTIYLPEGMAVKFAKDLAIKELNKNGQLPSKFRIKPIFEKCITDEDEEIENETKLEVEIENKNRKFCDECDSKGGRHKKDCPKNIKEEEFGGLK
ncbi:hypothetical protein [Persephonella sp.]